MTQTNNDEAFHKIMAQVQVYASSYALVGTRFATDNQLEKADREKLALCNMVKSALSQSPISQNEQQEVFNLEQILHDPENQPSQYGTVPLKWYENLENKINRIRFNVEQVIDSLSGSSDMHAIRKQLQTAIDEESIVTNDKQSFADILEKSLSHAKTQLDNYRKLSEVKHDTK